MQQGERKYGVLLPTIYTFQCNGAKESIFHHRKFCIMVPSIYTICACHGPNYYCVLAMFLLAVLTWLVNCYNLLTVGVLSGVIHYFPSTPGA